MQDATRLDFDDEEDEDEGWNPGTQLTVTIMKDKSTTPENAISRRHFLLSTGLATTALGLKPLMGMAAPTRQTPARTVASEKLCLWSDRPAEAWMTEALPIGNGPP